MRNTFTFLFLVLSISLFGQVVITNTTDYNTLGQMLLANEINDAGEPFAEALGYDLDELDPMVPMMPDSISYTLGIENYEYSRYQLGTVIARAGIGLHMMWSPLIMANAAADAEADPNFDGSFTGGTPNGFNEDDELRKTIMGFSMRTGYTPPQNPWPQFAEFMSGDPHLPQAVGSDFGENFATLRWDRSLMDKTLNPGAMGQTMMKQYLWAQDMLGGFHDGDEEEVDVHEDTPDMDGGFQFDPNNNVFYGGDNADGFIGMLATAEAINKTMFFRTKLAYNGTELGGVDPATYTPADGILYFPHKIAVTEAAVGPMLPPKMETLTVTDASSHLFDQLSFLWASLNFKNMMDPDNNSDDPHVAYHSVFDGDPFPAAASITGMPGPFDLMKGMSKVTFLNIMTMHFNAGMGSFVNVSNLVDGAPQLESEISAVEAGYIIAILSKFVEEFAGTPLETMAMDAINAQANFILTRFKDGDNGYYNSVTLGTGANTDTKLAMSQGAIARGLYAAYALTNNSDYLDGANAAYDALMMNYYMPSRKAFKTQEGNNLATYTPFNIAIITGALREASLVGNHAEAPVVFTRFFTTVGDKMQFSESGATGETGGDSDGDGIPFVPEQVDGLPPVFAPQATLELTTGIDDGLFAQRLNLRNFPNPFKGQTNITFDLEETTPFSIEIYDIKGRLVETLFDGQLTAGTHSFKWEDTGYAAGIYLYKLASGNQSVTSEIVLLK